VVLNSFQNWQIGDISRDTNYAMHDLAKTVVKQVIHEILMENFLSLLFCESNMLYHRDYD
jgi:hypothetical protein